MPTDALLGARGAGFLIAQQRLGPGRIHHCMRWLGVSRRAFDMLCERALSRYSHGSLLADKQTVQNWIADSAAQMQAARLMTLHAAWKMDTEGAAAARQEIALIKFFGAQVLHDVVDRALQAHGSLGYSTDLPLEQMYRFARAARLYDGPDEVHRQTVARQILRGYEAPADGVPTEHVPTRREAARRALRRPARGGDLERLSCAGSRARRRSCSALAAAACGSRPTATAPDRRRGADSVRPLRPRPRVRRPALPGRARAAAGRARSARGELAARLRERLPARAASSRCRPPGCERRRLDPPAAASRSSSPRTTTPRTCPGFVGANDGAGGTAAVLEIARALRTAKRPAGAPPIRFVLFDGEESPDDDAGLLRHRPARLEGRTRSRHARRAAGDDPARLRGREGRLRIPREASSDLALWRRLRAAARAVGAQSAFPDEDRRPDPRRPHAVPAPRRAGDRPDRLHVRLLAQALRRHGRPSRARSLDLRGRDRRAARS